MNEGRKEKSKEGKPVLYEKENFQEGAVATITLNKPQTLNAMDFDLTEELLAALSEAEDDDDVKAVIIRGAGGNFSSGYDLSRVYYVYGGGSGKSGKKEERPSQRSRLKYDRWRSESLRRVLMCSKITIAEISGYCIGGGLYTLLCCDLGIAAKDAKIGHSEQRMVFSGAMYVLPIEFLLIGPKKSRELLLTGKLIDGVEAERIGLVNKAVEKDDLQEEARRLAQAMTLLPKDGIAIGKAAAALAYDALGLNSSFAQGYIGHTMATNIKFEEGEFNFLKARRDVGVRKAVKQRDKRYEGLV
jgi:enoyl-CoA hydratase